ncbi:MAG: ParM/StbA family protein [Firmicutes bacterium]|nr:ParM/StbA family protein [Bacillota bacterium]
MHIAMDIGYSHVKSITTSNRVIIPSVVAPFRKLSLVDLSSQSDSGHVVEIRRVDGTTSKYFVGEMALREGHGASFSLDREKHRHPNHDILALAAARVLNTGPGAMVVAGLPVAYYRTQREELKNHLEGLHAEVSVNGNKLKRISFGKAVVYPQGAGALFMAPDLPQNGMVLLVDIGQKTTDYVTAEVAEGNVKPVSSLCGSVETGVQAIYEIVAQEFLSSTGMPLAAIRVPEIISQSGRITYYGKERDFSGVINQARTDIALAISDQVKAALGDRLAFIKKVYLAGGGAEMLRSMTSLFPEAYVLPEPQWANAAGFLKVVNAH